MTDNLLKTIFGRLAWASFPIHEPILLGTFVVVVLLGLAIVGAVTWFRLWGYLWHEWFTSVDHKKIGIMYVILGIIMLLRGFADALMMRAQQAIAFGANEGYLPAHHYDQIFTAHGTIMIFFVAIPLVVGIINYVMPLQIGARDVAFPFLNNLSFWLTAAGAALTMLSLFVGEFARTGWLSYAPLAGTRLQPGYRRRLLSLVSADRGDRHDPVGDQHGRDRRQDARPRHDDDEAAGLLLDGSVLERAGDRDLPGADRRLLPAHARPLRRHELLHERSWRRADDVLEHGVDLGTPGGLRPRSARIRHVFGDHLDLHRQAAVRLLVDGLRDRRHHDPVLPRLASPLLHDGRRARR